MSTYLLKRTIFQTITFPSWNTQLTLIHFYELISLLLTKNNTIQLLNTTQTSTLQQLSQLKLLTILRLILLTLLVHRTYLLFYIISIDYVNVVIIAQVVLNLLMSKQRPPKK